MSNWVAIFALIPTVNAFTIGEASAWYLSADPERLCVGKLAAQLGLSLRVDMRRWTEVLDPVPTHAHRSNDIKIVGRILCGERQIVLEVRRVNPRITSAMAHAEGIDVINKANHV